MAVGDKVEATRDIRSYVPKTLRIADDAIPKGTEGIVLQQDAENRVVTVKFDNGVIGNFGVGIVDGLDAISIVITPTTIDVQAEVTASIRAEQLASSRVAIGQPFPKVRFGGTSFGPQE